MKTVHIFNPPLHVLGNKSSVSDIDGLKIFKFYEHPKIRVPIEAMKTTARTHSTCLMGGDQTLELYQDSRTCCVQC